MLIWRLTVQAFEPGLPYPPITHVFLGETQEQVCETYHRHLACDSMLAQLTLEGLTCEAWDCCEPGAMPAPQPAPIPPERSPIPPDAIPPIEMRPPPPLRPPIPPTGRVPPPPVPPSFTVPPEPPTVTPGTSTLRPGVTAQPWSPSRPLRPVNGGARPVATRVPQPMPGFRAPPRSGGGVDMQAAARLGPWLHHLQQIR